ncbi:MAG: His Kinase (Phospho-acceptor) protein, partial [Verrucomicrobia bacterium]|nr:His Kinase (Phospho-acceptor) protein [Verrucomicrobiota bacterium]
MSIIAKRSLRQSAWVRYSIPLVTVVTAVLTTDGIRMINPRIPNLALLYCAAIFSGWFGGIGPGLVAALISSAAIAFGLVPSPYPHDSILLELPRVAFFSIAVVFVSWISGRQRRAEELLEDARDKLSEKVQEGTAQLRRTNDQLQAEIAERKSTEDTLQTMQAELAHVSRVTMMGELTASIAHEVNQPLGAIINYANACRRLLAADRGDMTSVDEALSKIVEDAHRASDVIARIRALSKKKPTEKSWSTVGDLIDDVVAIANYEMRARGVTVRVDLAAELPRLPVDRVQIQQVLLNLIINGAEAMESTPQENRVIEIRGRTGRFEDGPALILRIRDHGTGVK